MPELNPHVTDEPQCAWPWVLCLIGLDYFSTLAYQPSIAFNAAGRLAPLATALVAVVTLLGALPVYCYVAGRSTDGGGVVGLLARRLHGWRGKAVVLTLLGFVATDFVISKSLSASDAAVHIIHNADWRPSLEWVAQAEGWLRAHAPDGILLRAVDYWNLRLVVAVLVTLVGFAFWALFRHGFTRRVIQLSVLVVGLYLTVTGIVLVSGVARLVEHPEVFQQWLTDVRSGDWALAGAGGEDSGLGDAALVCLLAVPKLALSLGGFELTLIVMPLVRGAAEEEHKKPRQRIRNTRRMLVVAAVLMSLYLVASSLVTTLWISPEQFAPDGAAANRALAYLAHGEGARVLMPWFGSRFGALFDVAAVLMLGLAGASVMIGLKRLAPDYLLRFGMEFEWAHKIGATMHTFNAITLLVTVFFQASVDAQRGAYGTSVLVIFTSAALAAALGSAPGAWGVRRVPWAVLWGAFAALTVTSFFISPDGLVIALAFVVATITMSVVSRTIRSTELRFEGFTFADPESRFIWESLQHLDFRFLVPHRPGRRSLDRKDASIRRWHRLDEDAPVVFVEVTLDDPSEFLQRPLMKTKHNGGMVTLRISRCALIAHVIAAVALELSKQGPALEIHFGWSDENPMKHNLNFVLFGRGNVPWMVRELIRKAEPDPARQPRIIIG